jgi:D-3-phosphoglycerate dehydrogenase/C-terminal binding protein
LRPAGDSASRLNQLTLLTDENRMSRPRIVLTDFVSEPLDVERTVLGDQADLLCAMACNEEQLASVVADAAALMVYHEVCITRRTIERLNCCKLIVRCGAGYDNVDIAFARQRGIPVANVPDYGSEEVADSAIGMLLALARGIHFLNSRLRDSQEAWTYTHVVPVARLRGRVFGIVGLGRIGTATALRAKSLGMEVVFYDPYKSDGYDKAIGIRRAETVESLFRQSHALSLHCPLTDETRHLVNAESLTWLPRGAFLINTARGALVETDAIPDAVASGHLAGAAIDVLAVEPPSVSDKLVSAWRDPNHAAHHRVILNPHSAFYSEEGLRDMRIKGAQACLNAITGRPLRNVVN